jgi:16S rRNA G966 N2-methylase RsmD
MKKLLLKYRIPTNKHQLLLALKRYSWKLPVVIYERLYDQLFDFAHGTDTIGLVRLEDTELGQEGQKIGNQYQPSGIVMTKKVLKRVQKIGLNGFIDYGSGKGQVLIVASQMGFSPVVGVEFSDDLHRIAEHNMALIKKKNPKWLSPVLICKDARAYEVSKDLQVFYFFHPFKSPILSTVVDHIEKSLMEHPREGIIVYVYPKSREVIDSRPHWQIVDDFRVSDYQCLVYRYK